MVKITYTNNRDVDNLYFTGGWTGILYFDTVPKAGDVKYISNVEVKNGIDITKSKIVQEEHSIRLVASETMIKVLQKLPLFSDVNITVDSMEENKVYNLKFEIVKWIGGGSYAQCRMTYVIHTYVNKQASINVQQ